MKGGMLDHASNQPRALPFVHLPFNGISRAEPLAGWKYG